MSRPESNRDPNESEPPPSLSRSNPGNRVFLRLPAPPSHQPPPQDERYRSRQRSNEQSSRRPEHNGESYMETSNQRVPARSRSRSATRYANTARVRSSELKLTDIFSFIQYITMMYYDGEGTRAWRLKFQERAGFNPAPQPPADSWYPARVKFVCYVTVKGKRIISNDKLYYETQRNDKYLAGLLNDGYESTKKSAPWALSSVLSLKSIGAVEFQIWTQFEDDKEALLSDVESIPKEANRTSMSVFAYQLRNPSTGYNWTGQFDTIVQKACQIHDNTPNKYFVLVHIIEMLNMRILYIAFTGVLTFSIAGGAIYGALTADWGDAFTLAGLLLAAFSFVGALLALPEALGIEVPIFSTRNMYALDTREVTDWFENGHIRP